MFRSDKAFDVLESRGRPHVAFEAVGPRVIGTDNAAMVCGLTTRKQFVATVRTDVGERTQNVVVTTNQQDAAGSEGFGFLIAWLGDVLREAHAEPALLEKVPSFPVKNLVAHVGLRRQHPRITTGL
jgi:hypothetical protein